MCIIRCKQKTDIRNQLQTICLNYNVPCPTRISFRRTHWNAPQMDMLPVAERQEVASLLYCQGTRVNYITVM